MADVSRKLVFRLFRRKLNESTLEPYDFSHERFRKQRYADKLELNIVPTDALPLYNQDDELNPPQSVKEMKVQVAASDGILIVTPEYNHSIPASLKNTLDWCSRVDKVMGGKPAFIIGATPGAMGTVKAQMHLRQILNSGGIGTLTLPGNEVFIGAIHEKMNVDGIVTDEGTIGFLDTVVGNFMEWVQQLKR